MTLVWHQCVCRLLWDSLQSQLGPSPVSPLRVVPDFLTSFYGTPMDGMILPSFLGQESHDPQNLPRQHVKDRVKRTHQQQRKGEREIRVLEHRRGQGTEWVEWGRGGADTLEKRIQQSKSRVFVPAGDEAGPRPTV